MKPLFLLLTVSCLALGSPIVQEENQLDIIGGSDGGLVQEVENKLDIIGDSNGGLILAVADDEQQSVAVLNLGDEKIIEMEVNEGDNYIYNTRHFNKGGGYQFGYNSFNVKENEAKIFRHEYKHSDDTVIGSYGFIDPYGELQVTNYISDKGGFQILQPLDLVQLEPVLNNENVQGNEIRGRSNLLVDAPEVDVPIVHAVVPPGAQDLKNGPNSFGYFLTI